jgi:hypothetical protein
MSLTASRPTPRPAQNVLATRALQQRSAQRPAAPAQLQARRPALSLNRDGFESARPLRALASGGAMGASAVSTSVKGPGLKVSHSAKGSIGRNGVNVDISLKLDANLVSAGAKATRTFNVKLPGSETIKVKVDLAALGKVGADGKLNLKLHLSRSGQVSGGINISGFAGAKAGLTGGISVTHEGRKVLSGSLNVSAYAGAAFAAGANFKAGVKGISFSAQAKASVGIGAGVKISGSINTKNTARLAAEVLLPGNRR